MNTFSKIFNQLYIFGYQLRKGFSLGVSEIYIKAYLFLISFLNILVWILASSIKDRVGEERMALHYNVDFGVDFYDISTKIYIIPLVGLFVILVNFSLYLALSGGRDRKFFSHILFLTAFISNLVLLTALLFIYLVNFR